MMRESPADRVNKRESERLSLQKPEAFALLSLTQQLLFAEVQ
jgi:hypothetical protein